MTEEVRPIVFTSLSVMLAPRQSCQLRLRQRQTTMMNRKRKVQVLISSLYPVLRFAVFRLDGHD
jgi:hypothetical protein